MVKRLPVDEEAGGGGGTPEAITTWKAFLHSWIRFFGTPEIVVVDPSNEFRGRFERGLEHFGIYHHVTDRKSPWQNAKTERHGGWLKEKIDAEVAAGSCAPATLEKLGDFVIEPTAAKTLSHMST